MQNTLWVKEIVKERVSVSLFKKINNLNRSRKASADEQWMSPFSLEGKQLCGLLRLSQLSEKA